MAKAGRKSIYEDKILRNLDKISDLIQNGHSEEQVAKIIGVAPSTWYKYKKEFPEFSEAIKKNERTRDEAVENALYRRATGGYVTVRKPMKKKCIEYDKNGKKVREYEEIEYIDDEQYIPPDTAANIFWSINRMGDKYKNNPHQFKLNEKKLELEEKKAEKDDFKL